MAERGQQSAALVAGRGQQLELLLLERKKEKKIRVVVEKRRRGEEEENKRREEEKRESRCTYGGGDAHMAVAVGLLRTWEKKRAKRGEFSQKFLKLILNPLKWFGHDLAKSSPNRPRFEPT